MANGRLRIGHSSPASRILTAEYGAYSLTGAESALNYSNSGLILFEDDFSSGNLQKTGPNGGFFWGGNGGAADGSTGPNVSVISGFSRHGDIGNCLRFNFTGNWAEQRFSFGDAYEEVWLRWYQYFPEGNESPYRGPQVRRTAGGNNKLLRVYGPNETAPRFGSETFTTSPSGNELANLEAALTDGSSAIGGIDGTDINPFLSSATRGRWVKIEFHVRANQSHTTPTGEMHCWIDDVLRSSFTGLNSQLGNNLGGGYLWGSQNGLYANAGTQIYVSDFAFGAAGRV
jgi:hypothetical protein